MAEDNDIMLARMRKEQGDTLKELEEDPLDDYSTAASLFIRKGYTEEALGVVRLIEELGDGLPSSGSDPKRAYHTAAALYSALANTGDLQRVEKKLEKYSAVSPLEEKLKEALKLAQTQKEELKLAYQKEKQEIVTNASKEIVKRLLEVLDNFELAFKSLTDVEANVREGVQLVHRQLYASLEKEGLQKIDIKEGDKFNPFYHEAAGVLSLPNLPDDSVIAVNKTGYSFKGQVLRPAQVIVNKLS